MADMWQPHHSAPCRHLNETALSLPTSRRELPLLPYMNHLKFARRRRRKRAERCTLVPAEQADMAVSTRGLHHGLVQFLAPLLVRLDAQIDRHLVRTLLASVTAVLAFQHSTRGLLLSELGAYLAGPAQAPAGTKQLSNLLHSPKGATALIER
jgi:hypothetical protein